MVTSDSVPASASNVGLYVTSFLCVLLSACVVVLVIQNFRLRRRERPRKPEVVTKNARRSRTFSGPKDKTAVKAEDSQKHLCTGRNAGSSVVVDLEDCCKMTICDTVSN